MQLAQIRKLYYEMEGKLKPVMAAVMKLQEEVCAHSDLPRKTAAHLLCLLCDCLNLLVALHRDAAGVE